MGYKSHGRSRAPPKRFGQGSHREKLRASETVSTDKKRLWGWAVSS